ncbi:hypothetical protein A2Z33_03350 [Candidatus Gottesmanbacteria bacterium RBG_16_52_11]|uniref:Transport permease protein n=1 Tax=Candidatus Gottesmanbacteria bacterium RBG_16_52_11 TaxID=1798374 RepID=A0A1F5YW21_9BACT|nr:MAG: hypothetical protein A2Z33_03350 [Candidatus Gottesmanbacteria bacterium RBG_16_52_11]
MNLRHVQGILVRNFYLWFREVDRVFDAFWWSFFDIAIWGFMSSYFAGTTSPSIVGQLLTGLILWTVLSRSQWEISATMVVESWDRNLANIFTSPITLAEFLTASVILGVGKVLLVMSFTSLTAALMIGFNVFAISWWIIPLVGNIFLTGVWLAFIINAIILRFGKNAIAFAWTLVFVINPLSGVMYPISALPVPVQAVSRLLPSAYVFEGMRSLLTSRTIDVTLLWISLGLNLLYIAAGVGVYSYTFRKAREHGWLVKLA